MLRKKAKRNEPLQRDLRKDPFDDPSSIGNVLLKLGKVTREQLWRALGQRAQFDDMLLGSLLKQMGYVHDLDIAYALQIQAEMRQGNPLTAELDVLQSKMDESAAGAAELSARIRGARTRRRVRGEKSGLFLVAPAARAQG